MRMPRGKSRQKRLRVSPQLTKAEIKELKQRALADGRFVATYVTVLLIEDLRKGKPVLRANQGGRETQALDLNLTLGLLSRPKMEARAKAEMRSLSGYVARVIVRDLGR